MPPNSLQQTLLDEATHHPGGTIPFIRFMALALYHPTFGYYMTERSRVGKDGDFITAPSLSSLFGEMLTLQWVQVWELLGKPARFKVVEAGPGTGQLAKDILNTASRFPTFKQALEYHLIEISPDFQQRQKAEIGSENATWHTSLNDLPDGFIKHGVLFSNELLDALPVHWLQQGDEGLQEVAAQWDGKTWNEILVPVKAPLKPDWFSQRGITLQPGTRAEIGLLAGEWIQQAAAKLGAGLLLTIDYGYPRKDLYSAAHTEGTLMGHYQHKRVMNPLEHPGAMDLTAHVDFTTLFEMGKKAGLTGVGFTTQAWFLMGLGILERLQSQMERQDDPAAQQRLKQAVMRLLMPDAMGERFKVIGLGRNLPDEPLFGFSMQDQRDRL